MVLLAQPIKMLRSVQTFAYLPAQPIRKHLAIQPQYQRTQHLLSVRMLAAQNTACGVHIFGLVVTHFEYA